MKILRLLAAIVLFSMASFAIYIAYGVAKKQEIADSFRDPKNIQKIYHQLVIAVGERGLPDTVIISSAKDINAWTDGVNITITTALINVIQNKDQLAFILAHEMAHYINADVYTESIPQTLKEAHADKLGAFIMMRAGFDECKGKEVFKVFLDNYGDSALATDHPSLAYRLDQVTLPMCN